jgi:YidC/Oxa1 family membrane protein insertase
MNETRNYIVAIALSLVVLIGWQMFVAGPQFERAQRQAELAQQDAAAAQGETQPNLPEPGAVPSGDAAVAPAVPGASASTTGTREERIASSPRTPIDTPSLSGSINLRGGRIDDLSLKKYRETLDPQSDIITLFSPAGAPHPYYAQQGWRPPTGSTVTVPDNETIWEVEGAATLAPGQPVTLKWDNGEGLIFRQTYAVDADYLFTVTQSVENTGDGDVSLHPFSLVSRHETPKTAGFFILHEGPIGVLGGNLDEVNYKDVKEQRQKDYESTGGWLGITDKYFAAAVFPPVDNTINARFAYTTINGGDAYQASFVGSAPVVAPAGGSATSTSYVFAGAKVEAIIEGYEADLGVDRLELLIDWGWLHFITKPMFYLIRWLYGILGNFGLAILAVTVLVKLVFLWFANKSYASMAGMKKVQPEVKRLQEVYKDDRAEQQKQMMELYKREKINPLSGCWPVLIQIPVFFSLYKVLFVTIEMRHAPFFGWIRDLAAPDPTHVFTLFGLLPYDPTLVPVIGPFLAIGAWPIIMGVTMFLQMRLNPPPPDPTQAMIFAWMPIIFTFMLAGFPAGLVIYWAWNNSLSIIQQYVIMKRHGADPDLIGNTRAIFRRKPSDGASG